LLRGVEDSFCVAEHCNFDNMAIVLHSYTEALYSSVGKKTKE